MKLKSQTSYDLVAFSSACRVIFQFLHSRLSLTSAFLWLCVVLAPQSNSTLPTMQTQETEAVALSSSACYYPPETGLPFRATQTNCWLLSIPVKNGKSDLSQSQVLEKGEAIKWEVVDGGYLTMTVTLAIPPYMEKLGARYWSRSRGSQKQPDDMMMVAAGEKKRNRPQWKRKETMERVSCRITQHLAE